MKHEWKKHEKEFYGAKAAARLITVPMQSYITIKGKGNPNAEDFSQRVGALYSLAYAVKMACKVAAADSIMDFAVYPLEGVWQKKTGSALVKDDLEYTIMIRQPDFVTEEMVLAALEKTKKKKPSPLLDEIHFDTSEDGLCIEILHVGSFDDEPASFEKMDQLTKQKGLERKQACHREIYLSNANRVLKSKLKTILRYQVEEQTV